VNVSSCRIQKISFINKGLRRCLMMGVCAAFALSGCAQGLEPQTRNVEIPAPVKAESRKKAINERPDSVMYLPLGRDILVPEAAGVDPLPRDIVGPFELRGETLGGALQLILSDVDIPIAFETDKGLTQKVTVTNLKGPLSKVVDQVCSLADLFCAYENGSLVVKDRQTYTVSIPPFGTADERSGIMDNIAKSIEALVGGSPVVDPSNRTIVYQATSRSTERVNQYLARLRAGTALIIYETYVWEVSLNSGNTAGINWSLLNNVEDFKVGLSVGGSADSNVGTPISIGLPTKGEVDFETGDVLKFISAYGAVKTISQPQLTVLSGSKAKLRVVDKENYVSKITRTVTGDQVTVSTETDSVESGFTLQIASNWDRSTVYGDINILLQELREIQTFDDNPEAIVQLPKTTEREVVTQVRIRPGDSLLIAGLVREVDNMNKEGLGLEKPIIPVSRTGKTSNVELVFLLKPRVVVFTDTPDRYEDTRVSKKSGVEDAVDESSVPDDQDMDVSSGALTDEPKADEQKKQSGQKPVFLRRGKTYTEPADHDVTSIQDNRVSPASAPEGDVTGKEKGPESANVFIKPSVVSDKENEPSKADSRTVSPNLDGDAVIKTDDPVAVEPLPAKASTAPAAGIKNEKPGVPKTLKAASKKASSSAGKERQNLDAVNADAPELPTSRLQKDTEKRVGSTVNGEISDLTQKLLKTPDSSLSTPFPDQQAPAGQMLRSPVTIPSSPPEDEDPVPPPLFGDSPSVSGGTP
jgi:hypothetical protein